MLATDAENDSVMISWDIVEGADRYSVTLLKTTGDDQAGLCLTARHIASVSIHAPKNSVCISVGQRPAQDDTTMLRAYTTYSITVVAESDAGGNQWRQ